MPTRKIDPDQAYAMAWAGCPATVIARRLGCSPRHARRFTAATGHPPNPHVGTEREVHLWRLHYRTRGSYQAVARTFGVTRQRVRQALT